MASISRQPRGDAFVASLIESIDITPQTKYGAGPEASTFNVVINGKRYSSASLESVVAYSTTDHEFGNYAMEEYLWQSPSGNWLLSGHGGSGTPWWDYPNSDSWGYGFIALSESQAKTYLEVRQMYDELQEQFPVEDA